MTIKKIDYVDIKLAVDFGDMPTNAAQRAADEIREAVSRYGKPHIKVVYRENKHRYDEGCKTRTVEVTSTALGTTPIGEAIVAALGRTWNT